MTSWHARRIEKEHGLYLGLLRLSEESDARALLEAALRLIVRVTRADFAFLEVGEARAYFDDTEVRATPDGGRATVATTATDATLMDLKRRELGRLAEEMPELALRAPVDLPQGVLLLARSAEPFVDDDQRCAEIFAARLPQLVRTITERKRLSASLDPTDAFRKRLELDRLVGVSKALASVFQEISRTAPLHLPVHLFGEAGSGKTEVARALHRNGPSACEPFVEFDCAVVPLNVIERSLAAHGTLVLDRIEALSAKAQARLALSMNARESDSGSARRAPRIVTTTCEDLRRAVEAGRFRSDLLFRLEVLSIRIPSLAERRDDVGLLARHFLAERGKEQGRETLELSRRAEHLFTTSDGAGNVRELREGVEAAARRAEAQGATRIDESHVRDGARSGERPGHASFREATRAYQRMLVRSTLVATSGDVAEAAQRLDLTRAEVYALLRGLNREFSA